MLSTVAEIIRDLLIFVGVIAALLIALIVVVAKLPATNPLKRLLTALVIGLERPWRRQQLQFLWSPFQELTSLMMLPSRLP